VNPLFVLVLAPVVARWWQKLGSRAPSTQTKMALGLVALGLGYLIMVLAAAKSDRGTLVSPWYLISFYFVYSMSELCFLPAGFSFVGQAAPARLASMLMGLWLAANFLANLIGGYLAGMIEGFERGKFAWALGGQADFFLLFVVSCLGAGALLYLLLPLITRLMRSVAAR
jgi:proton-dependent oligopeptide transporter, POT family